MFKRATRASSHINSCDTKDDQIGANAWHSFYIFKVSGVVAGFPKVQQLIQPQLVPLLVQFRSAHCRQEQIQPLHAPACGVVERAESRFEQVKNFLRGSGRKVAAKVFVSKIHWCFVFKHTM
jgi:hypothetical protein